MDENTPPYPFIEHQRRWGFDIDFLMDWPKSESWYGIKGEMEKCGGDARRALQSMDNFNPWLRGIIHPGDVVLDVGANEGGTTVLFAKQVGLHGKVIAFEPDRENFRRLRSNVELNRLANVELVNALVTEKSGDSEYFADEIIQHDGRGTKIQTVCLDDFLDRNPTVAKIDVEGYELAVLRGATKLMDRGVRMEVEIHLNPDGVHMSRHGFDPRELWDLLESHGYKMSLAGVGITQPPQYGCVICRKN